MRQQIVGPVECGNCHRMTLTYNITEQGMKLCPVCITELSQGQQLRPGPSEIKQSFGPVVSWNSDCGVGHRGKAEGCGSCSSCYPPKIRI